MQFKKQCERYFYNLRYMLYLFTIFVLLKEIVHIWFCKIVHIWFDHYPN